MVMNAEDEARGNQLDLGGYGKWAGTVDGEGGDEGATGSAEESEHASATGNGKAKEASEIKTMIKKLTHKVDGIQVANASGAPSLAWTKKLCSR